MLAISQRFVSRPRQLPHGLAAPVAVAALVFGYCWAFVVVPSLVHSVLLTYLLPALGWSAVFLLCRLLLAGTPALDGSREHDAALVLSIAAVIGAFLVALRLLVGVLAGFGHSPYAHSPVWLAINFVYVATPLLAIESSRLVLIRSLGQYSLTLTLLGTSIGLAALRFPSEQFVQDGLRAQTEFWGGQFIPLAAAGLLAGFFVAYGGLRAALLVAGIPLLFEFYSPILPSAPWHMLALAGVAGPAMGLWLAEGLFSDEQSGDQTEASGLPSVAWVVTAVMGLVIFWFSFGFFGFRPAFVPSHSMEPAIERGDVVLVGPVAPDAIRVGDVILYKMPNGQRVLHRVIEIQHSPEGAREFVFKGDNNGTSDPVPVSDKAIVGRYITRVPKLGWVPIQFNRMVGAMLK